MRAAHAARYEAGTQRRAASQRRRMESLCSLERWPAWQAVCHSTVALVAARRSCASLTLEGGCRGRWGRCDRGGRLAVRLRTPVERGLIAGRRSVIVTVACL